MMEMGGGVCVMQGWYEHSGLDFLPNRHIVPVWVGTHFQNSTRRRLQWLLRLRPNAFSQWEIGCRDFSTLEFCRKHKINAYFSRCLTLTLPKRKCAPKSPKVFIVNCSDDVIEKIPEHIKTNAEYVNQRAVELGFADGDAPKYDVAAMSLLTRYKEEAGLVVTSALHCAQPCLVMGIPVVFVHPGRSEADRFSAMTGLIPIYTKEDLERGRVDWNQKAPDIEELKRDLLENLRLSKNKALGEKVDEFVLTAIRRRILDFSTRKNFSTKHDFAHNKAFSTQ